MLAPHMLIYSVPVSMGLYGEPLVLRPDLWSLPVQAYQPACGCWCNAGITNFALLSMLQVCFCGCAGLDVMCQKGLPAMPSGSATSHERSVWHDTQTGHFCWPAGKGFCLATVAGTWTAALTQDEVWLKPLEPCMPQHLGPASRHLCLQILGDDR